MIITNDKFRDHIFKISKDDLISNSLSRWRENHIISYNPHNDKVELTFPSKISYIIQKNGDKWHIPIGDGKWRCC